MLTADDFDKLVDFFATKQELKDMEHRLIAGLVSKKEFRALRDIIETGFGSSKVKEDEDLIHRQEHEDLSGRLTNIESIPTIAHELKTTRN